MLPVCSIIGSECTLDLEVKTPEARDAVVSRFVLWVQLDHEKRRKQ